MERACALDPEYPRIWLEYDQLSDFIYYQGLANLELGLGENEKARELIQEILTKQSDHQGALGR